MFWFLGQLIATGVQIFLYFVDFTIVIMTFGKVKSNLSWKFTMWRIRNTK